MHKRPRLLDLFSGAGGAAMGYFRAGFLDIVGIDIQPQPRYPFTFVQADALEYLAAHGYEFDVIHASPPCQGYSRMRHLPWLREKTYPLLIEAVQAACNGIGRPWVIENVEDAPLDGLVLCGTQFDLPLYRHRRFASNLLFLGPPHLQHTQVICAGRRNLSTRYRLGGRRDVTGTFANTCASTAMGIHWMSQAELSQAIPPAYTEWIGRQLLRSLASRLYKEVV